MSARVRELRLLAAVLGMLVACSDSTAPTENNAA
jgi:hypothetical protein